MRFVNYRDELVKLTNLPSNIEGVFAIDNVSGCYGPFGLYLWGCGTHNVMKVFGSEEDVFIPKKVEGIEKVKAVCASETHIIVMCDLAENSKKREGAPIEEEEVKKAKVEEQ